MSEFGDGTLDQRILDWIKMEMTDPDDESERRKVIRVLARIIQMWLDDD